MKLSEAIRLGAMLKPQIRYETRDGSGTCVLGAALDAVGDPGVYTNAFQRWPITSRPCRHPLQPNDGDGWLLLSVCRDLNDEYCWTREQIADWVESIEVQHEQPSVQPDFVPLPVGERVSK